MEIVVSVSAPSALPFVAAVLLGRSAFISAYGAPAPQCTSETPQQQQQQQQQPLECHIYMAPSTLGEETNMGMYTGVDLKEGDVINFPEIAVPLLFREWGEHAEGFTDGQLWERYIWEGSVANLETYDETDLDVSKAAFIPGIGCTINAVMDMYNIESTHGSTYDTAGLHRSRDPGSGAFAGYHSSITNAEEDIPAGSELFAAYGTDWIPDIPGAQVTLDPQLDKADDFLIDDYLPFIKKHTNELSDEIKQALWEFTYKDFPVYSQSMTNLPRYPWHEVENFAKEDKDLEEVSIVRHFIRKQHKRSLEWLQTHPNSYCQDHLRPGNSTIPQAGRGAFANRDLPKGTVVGYAPLIHIGKDGRQIFHIEYTDVYKRGKRHMYDLIINYSFGHPNSTMLLTPYGGMVNYINHAPVGVANVQVRFPDKELVAHKPDWLLKDPDFFHHQIDKIGVSFEYVALRDIHEGEEVLMDYGEVWEQAWEEHIKNWEPLEGSEDYIHSSRWNEPFFRTLEEQETNPYPNNLQTMCIASYTKADDEFVFVDVLQNETTSRWYCDVVERNGNDVDGYLYDIDLRIDRPKNARNGEGVQQPVEESWVHVIDVDPTAIFLMDKAFTTDWHLPYAFRQYIQIPNDIMPEAWKNGPDPYQLPQEEESDE